MKPVSHPICRVVIFVLGLCSVVGINNVWAETEARYNQVRLDARSTEQVKNDRMQATLSVFGEDQDPASLADRINNTMEWALAISADYDNVQAKTGGYQTYPIHQKNIFRGWRGSQELILEAGDFQELGSLIGKLQERMQVNSMGFSMFPRTLAAAEDQLIYAALEKFKSRADLVRDNMAASGYRIVDITINTGSGMPRPMRMTRQMAEMDAVAAPAVKAGESTVTVTVSGVIELE